MSWSSFTYMVSIKTFCKRKQKILKKCFPGFERVGRVITMHFIFHFVSLPRQISLMGWKDKYEYFVFLGLCLFGFSSMAKRVCTTLLFQKRQLKRELLMGNHLKLRFQSVEILGLNISVLEELSHEINPFIYWEDMLCLHCPFDHKDIKMQLSSAKILKY